MLALTLLGLFNPSLQRGRYSFFLDMRIPQICHRLNMCGFSLVARDPSPVASAEKLWVRIQKIWNALPQAGIQNLFDSMPRRLAALIAARDGYTKYSFRSLAIVCLLSKFNHLFVRLPHNCVLGFI